MEDRRPLTALIPVLTFLPCLLLANGPDTVNTEALPEYSPASFEVIASETLAAFGGGYLGSLVLGIAGLAAGFGLDHALNPPSGVHTSTVWLPPPAVWMGASLGSGIGLPLGSALAVCGAGRSRNQGGRFWPAFGWTALAEVGAYGLVALGAGIANLSHNPGESAGEYVAMAGSVAFFASPAAAVIAYNRSRPKPVAEGRARLGGIRLANQSFPDGATQAVLDLRLVNVRF